MADRREQIVNAATEAIKRDGLRSISFRTLADEVGVKSSSVHYHFPTKSHLAQQVVSRYTEEFVDRLAAIGYREKTLVGKLDGLVSVFEGVIDTQDLCLCGMMSAELTSLDDSTRGALKRFFRESEEWLESVFVEHAADLATDLGARDLAILFMSGLEGASLVDRVQESRERLEAFRRLARALTN
ncbi:MAG: TetR/AcrR family transcriptional regulator [Pseudomonadota bacterium]